MRVINGRFTCQNVSSIAAGGVIGVSVHVFVLSMCVPTICKLIHPLAVIQC